MEKQYNKESGLYCVKKTLDKILPLILIVLVIYLYLELFASSTNILYHQKTYLQYVLLAYFTADLMVLFSMYEENREFFRNHWFDILLTIPFFTAFKGLKGFRIIKLTQTTYFLKLTKSLKTVKIVQKTVKLGKKGRKLVHKLNY